MLTGVAGGMAEYFDIDPVLARLVWVVFCFVTAGMGLLLYIVFAIIMPRQETIDAEPRVASKMQSIQSASSWSSS